MLRLVGRSAGFADDETRLLATIADRLAVHLEQERLRAEANRAEILRRTDELRTVLLSSVSHASGLVRSRRARPRGDRAARAAVA
jgi:K+-sensing histidine kinase KdpD